MVQLMISREKQIVQQLVIASMPTTVQVTTSLTTHIPRGSDHQTLNGGQLGDSPKGSSLKEDMPREPPFNPLIEPFGWLALDPHMFIPPWY